MGWTLIILAALALSAAVALLTTRYLREEPDTTEQARPLTDYGPVTGDEEWCMRHKCPNMPGDCGFCEVHCVCLDSPSGSAFEGEPETRWVTTNFDNGRTQIEHLDGVAWHDAPIPPKRHTCTPQTKGWVNYFTQVFRCACGAISADLHQWDERNTRVKR